MPTHKKSQLKGVIFLLTATFVWGISFVAQDAGMKIGGFTFNGLRMVLGGSCMIPIILLMDKKKKKSMTVEEIARAKASDKQTIRSGMLLGLILVVAANLQQFAFVESSSGKIAFITTMYMFFTPLLGLPFGKRISKRVWFCVFLGFLGLFFLSVNPSDLTAINGGDVLALIGAIVFAIHILVIEKVAPEADGLKLSCVQFLTAGSISLVMMLIFEHPSWALISSAAIPILYAGLMGCDVGYTLQILGQNEVEATVASLLLSMEAVFGALSAAVLIGERLLGREILGCAIMFTAVILSQLPEKSAKQL